MAYNINFMYRAYKEFVDKMRLTQSYNDIHEKLREDENGIDSLDDEISVREIDMQWVETIEKALPFIDGAIRENRRFIVQEEEIVPIEKSRKISNESVRHLAQHTNMIARVEDGFVTPEKILNIRKEETFNVYENRFLKTLIQKALGFVNLRYDALAQLPEKSFANIKMQHSVTVRGESMGFDLIYTGETIENEEFDIYEK